MQKNTHTLQTRNRELFSLFQEITGKKIHKAVIRQDPNWQKSRVQEYSL